jgi:hypothetical protein
MIMTANELKEIHLEALAKLYDPMLARHCFTRNRRSVDAKRIVGESAQSIWLYCRPPHGNGVTIAYLGARLDVRFPEIGDIIARLVKKDKVTPHLVGLVGGYELENLMPAHDALRWYPSGADELSAAEAEVSEEVERWIMPFAYEAATEEGFVRLWESNDPRLDSGFNTKIGMIALYIKHGELDKAKGLAHLIFDDKPNLKNVYAPGIDYVFEL